MSTTLDTRIGDRIRALRAERGLTLDGLASAAEVSRAMLSRIERGESSASAQLLNKVCGGLGISLSALFAATEAAASPLRRRADQPVWTDPASLYVRRAVSPPGAPMEVAEITLPPGADVAFDNHRVAFTDQHVWVLEGALRVTVGGVLHELAAGDCLHMRLDQPVRFHNQGGQPARYAVIISRGPRP